jgi:hypothetical protein
MASLRDPATSNGLNNIAVIQADDGLVHIISGVAELLPQANIVDPGCGLLFADVEGHWLVPRYDTEWRLVALHRTADRPRPGRVRRHLQAWLMNFQAFAEQLTQVELEAALPALSLATGGSAEALARIKTAAAAAPDLSYEPLPRCFDLVRDFAPGGGGDLGDPIHLAAHVRGTAHR